MKTICTLKSWSIAIFILIVLFPPVFAQARYKHLPRVRIEKTTTTEKPVVSPTIQIPVVIENNSTEEQPITPEVTEVATVATENVTLAPDKKVNHFKVKTIEKSKKENKQAFSERVKKKSYLFEVTEVKTVKKTMIIGYLLWFFIVLLLAAAIFTLAFVFLGIIAYSLYYVFLVFGIAGFLIALLILIFGLTEVIA
jgi:hypothetical protein